MVKTCREGRQVLWNRSVHAQLRPVAWGVEVAAGGNQQPELAGQDGQRPHLIRRLHTVDHFDGVAAGTDEIRNQLASLGSSEVVVVGMRQADPRPGSPQGRDRVRQARPVLLHIAELAGPQPLAKRLGTVADMPGTHQELGEVRAGRRIAAVAQLALDGPSPLQGARHALGCQPPVDLLGAGPAPVVQVRDSGGKRRRIVAEAVAKHMDGRPTPGAGQLHAVDQLHVQTSGGRASLRQPFEGVVIGQRQHPDTPFVGARHQRGGRQGAVGGCAVAVQIDVHEARFRWRNGLLLCRHIPLLAAAVKQFIDFIPLVLFFIVYKLEPRAIELAGHSVMLGGIFSATAVLIATSVVVYGALFISQRRLEKGQWLTLVACLVFGGLTLAFHSETFLKWKAPVVNWLFALGFAASHFIGDRPLIQRIMGHAVSLPQPIWVRLNLAWIVFFLVCGFANLFVAFTFQSIWVDFKVFGSLGMTLLFLVGQGIFLARHMHDSEPDKPQE